MNDLFALLSRQDVQPPLDQAAARALAAQLGKIAAADVYWRSVAAAHKALFFLGRQDAASAEGVRKYLFLLYDGENAALDGFAGADTDTIVDGRAFNLRICATTYPNALALHAALPFTKPATLGLKTSAGCGDRLGLATPGHVRAVRKTWSALPVEPVETGGGVAPIFTQQSIREMERTGRTPEDVVNDGTWGVFQEGWRGGYGADADHLKTRADVDACVAAGFTFYTFDPREHVDNDAHSEPLSVLKTKVAALPWDRLDDDETALRARYLKVFDIEGDFTLIFDEETLLRAAAKYGRAIAHVAEMYHYLAHALIEPVEISGVSAGSTHAAGSTGRPFEVEVSVDETDTTTSPEEHFFIASELRRLGVQWVSLAPRYVGRFEKGVDYIGDLAEFERQIVRHAAIARQCGPYKLSIHSGSDKFAIYPIMARHTHNLVHLKTAGTSYLEALRAIAAIDPPLFRNILDFSFERYEQDKVSYHVSADPAQALASSSLANEELAHTLDNFHNRQMLHVTFGSVLNDERFRARFFAALRENEEAYYRVLEAHFDRHLEAFK
ncbi:MAG: hypothetical protein JW934_12410 [Anaerolineae bacterium]|nr:hypothetical protein [Anaerolineae bacterium]